ncbi:MAG TPA: thiolase domain-containing protein [Nitrososphaerales archaeon]|jgi:acetyl-CoA C-acetyltransferase|nr:thiolase domain-containing protein [Nitrososphaerales archaeon]PXF24060.1 MAG: acetyl-CoA acetyltransferase [Nitrososphaerota archaeon]HIC84228.1 thiolase domain-containing protein [Nitrososphaerales archaeon]
MNKVFLIGAAGTKYGKSNLTARDLSMLASKHAIESSGIKSHDIQAAFVANAFGMAEKQGHLGPLLMSSLGIPHVPSSTIEAACCSGGSAFREAYVNVASGFYDVMLVTGTEKVSHLDTLTATTYFAYGGDYLFEGNSGASFPGLYAAMARAHMHEHGTTEEELAAVAVKNHNNGIFNEKAHLQKKITVDDVLKSPVVADPLKFFDSCPFSDGAAAAIIASEEFMNKNGLEKKVSIKGSGRSGGSGSLHTRDNISSLESTIKASREAFGQAGINVKEIDFAEVHDCFTIAEIIAMEDLGIFEKGQASKAVVEGRTAINGEIPINPSGGLKSKGHPVGATGVGQIVEVFDQLTGNSGKRQVNDARIGLTHNVGATGGSCAVHIFERE